jgi:hypothetical protein
LPDRSPARAFTEPVNAGKQTGQMTHPPQDTRFKPGQSGNPNGRPQGSRSKVCVALDALAEGEAEEIVKAMIEQAKEGDGQSGRVILERIWPPSA